MDAFQLLKNDHQKARRIFEKLADTSPGARQTRDKLFADLKQELEIHTQIEENIFYPALQDAEETADLVEESLEEHQSVKELLQEMESTPKNNGEWDDMLEELRTSVEHHVEEEEGELFLKARDVLSMDTREELGNRMQKQKDELQGSA